VSLHISRAQIKNFRNFADMDVVLQPTSVLLGENKAGKSNFLFALRLVLDNTLPDSSRILRPKDFYDGLANPIGETVEVSVELSGFDANIGAKAILQKYLISVNPPIARLTYQFRPRQTLQGAQPQSVLDYELLFLDMGKQDACTDPICYQAKVDAHVAKTLAAKPKLVQISTAYGQQKEGSVTLPRNKYVEVRPDKSSSKEEATRPEFKTCKFTTEAIVSEGIDKGEPASALLLPSLRPFQSG
jgi:AAA ATPase domain